MSKKNKKQNDLNNENEKPILEVVTEEEVLEEQKKEQSIEISLEESKVETENEFKQENSQKETKKEKNEIIEDVKDETKNQNKVKIIDVSKNKQDNKKQELYYKLEGFASNLGFSQTEEIVEKVFDSLIFLGGGFLASTNLATKTISSLAEKLMK